MKPRTAIVFFPLWATTANVWAASMPIGISIGEAAEADLALPIRILLLLTVLSLAPSILIMTTAFTRIVVVLTMLRHALGMQDTPPNTVLVSLALFLTFFTMTPVIDAVRVKAYQPYVNHEMKADKAIEVTVNELKGFMVRQTRQQDVALMLELSDAPQPVKAEDIALTELIPAFMLSELKTAFQIGFVIFLPFLLIDLAVSSVLMAMGMMMVPPVAISLPIKILVFVLIDGWSLLARSLVGGFH